MARTAGTVTLLGWSIFSSLGPEGDRRRKDECILLPYAPSRSVDSGSKRYVVLRSLLRISNLLHELIEMRRGVHEVDVVRVHHQQWRFLVPVKVVRIRLAEFLQILWRDRFLVGSPALLDAPQQCIKVALEVDDQVRLGNRLMQQVIEPVVDHQLGVLERQVGKDAAL